MMKALSALEVEEGMRLPRFYYGLAYFDFSKSAKVYYVIPVNYVVRLGRIIRFIWNSVRTKPTYIDQTIQLEVCKIKDKLKENFYRDIKEERDLIRARLNSQYYSDVQKEVDRRVRDIDAFMNGFKDNIDNASQSN